MKHGKLTEFYRAHTAQIILVLIILVSIFFRFYRLNSLPPGLHPDEAANGLDIFRMIDHHDFRPLYNTNGPREALFFYLQAIFVLIMGNTILALRMAPAIIGVAGVYAVYLWSKSWFGQRVGLLSAAIMAVNPWAVTITRDGFRASMTPLMVALTLWAYTLALRTRKTKWFVIAGGIMSLGMYTYLSFKLFPLALVVIWSFMELWRKDIVKPLRKQLVISLVAFVIVLIPMGIYAIKHPGDVFARAGGVSFLEPSLNHGHPIQTLFSTIGKTALMFNVHGDENYRQNLGGAPELNIFVGLMFLFGIILCLTRLNKTRYFGLLVVFAVMLLPEVLTAEGIPHALRAIGAMPEALILAAVGIDYMLERWYATFPINAAARSAGLGIVVVLLLLSLYQGYEQYFVAWANSPQTYAAYAEDASSIGHYIIAHPFKGTRYVLIDGYTDKTVFYLTHYHATYTRIDPSDIANLPKTGAKEFFISNEDHDDSIKALRAHFAGGQLSPEYSTFNGAELYDIYVVGQ